MKRSLIPLILLAATTGCLKSRGTVDVPADAAAVGDPAALTLSDGAAVALTRANLRFDDVLFEEPAVADRGSLWIRTAQAHPGHDDSGAEMGELAGSFEVDLLAGPTNLGTAGLLEGSYATARMSWPGDAPAVVLEGTVTEPGGQPTPFAFAVQEERVVTNMPFSAEVDAATPPTSLHLRVDLARMLDTADWTTADSDGDGVLTSSDGDLDAEIRFGARTSAAYTWELTP